jgi:hypothetical protein
MSGSSGVKTVADICDESGGDAGIFSIWERRARKPGAGIAPASSVVDRGRRTFWGEGQ